MEEIDGNLLWRAGCHYEAKIEPAEDGFYIISTCSGKKSFYTFEQAKELDMTEFVNSKEEKQKIVIKGK